MLIALAISLLVVFTAIVMSARVSVVVALVLTPMAFGLLGGFGTQLGSMAFAGLQQIAPTAAMLAFAIWYFSLMKDAGLFDPLLRLTLRLIDYDPVRISVGTAVLALLVSVDGDGSTTYLICCAALMPVYERVRMNPLILSCLLMLSVGITNLVPWGGPTARVASVLGVEPAEVFLPLLPSMLAGALFVVGLAYALGLRERKRLQLLGGADFTSDIPADAAFGQAGEAGEDIRRPRLLWFNLALTAVLMVGLVLGILPLSILFMMATAIALIVNYPSLSAQKARLTAHASSIMNVVLVIFAAGVFVGILNGTGMSAALAEGAVKIMPAEMGSYLAPITALLSIPFTFLMTNDPFFFGVVPFLSQSAGHYGIEPVEMARAALLDGAVHLLSPMIPSTHLLVALAGVHFGRHLRFTMPWAILLSLIILAASLLTGAIPFRG